MAQWPPDDGREPGGAGLGGSQRGDSVAGLGGPLPAAQLAAADDLAGLGGTGEGQPGGHGGHLERAPLSASRVTRVYPDHALLRRSAPRFGPGRKISRAGSRKRSCKPNRDSPSLSDYSKCRVVGGPGQVGGGPDASRAARLMASSWPPGTAQVEAKSRLSGLQARHGT